MTETDFKEKALKKIEETAYKYEKEYRGCSQCTLRALQEHLNIGNKEVFKAASAFAGGYADSGNICGALSGGLMAIGLVYGRHRLEEESVSSEYHKAMELGSELIERFKKEFGSIRCWDIQDSIFGRHFDFGSRGNAREATHEEFEKVGGHEKCANVVRKAARLAACIILEARGESS